MGKGIIHLVLHVGVQKEGEERLLVGSRGGINQWPGWWACSRWSWAVGGEAGQRVGLLARQASCLALGSDDRLA